jgi:hypothetical protein
MQNSVSHHFVPQWYQRQFLPPEGGEFLVLDKSPATHVVGGDGKRRPIRSPRSTFRCGPKKLFQKPGLYSAALRGVPDDAIERIVFGRLDDIGAKAASLFSDWPVSNGFFSPNDDQIPEKYGHPSHRMQDLLEYLDAQKARTPKGIAQIKTVLARAGRLGASNTVLMQHLLNRRKVNCTVWAEGVWEIFSAKKASIKFILSDDPVVIYNLDCYPASLACQYPNDPDPFWRGSRVIFPLSPDAVLVISHIEHVDDPSRQKAQRPRRNARSYDETLISHTDIVNNRELSDENVATINYVLKTRAVRYVASQITDFLYPEKIVDNPKWCDIDRIFHAKHPSWRGETETYIRYKDGTIRHSNAFGERDIVPGWFVRQQEAKKGNAEETE